MITKALIDELAKEFQEQMEGKREALSSARALSCENPGDPTNFLNLHALIAELNAGSRFRRFFDDLYAALEEEKPAKHTLTHALHPVRDPDFPTTTKEVRMCGALDGQVTWTWNEIDCPDCRVRVGKQWSGASDAP